MKNIILALFLSKPGWDRLRKREKKFRPEFWSYPTRARKFQKKKRQKNWKTSVQHYFYTNRDEIGRESEKKNFIPNSIPTQLGLEICKKKKKIVKKFKKYHSSNISIQTGLRKAEKRGKKILPKFRFNPTRARKF